MKNMIRFTNNLGCRLGALVLCAGLMGGHSLRAASTPAVKAPEEEPIFSNWIDFTLGGIVPNGNMAEFNRQNPNLKGPIFGGIDDMHLEQSLGKANFTVDARAIFANSDYKVKLMLSVPDVGYIAGGFTEFATYSNGNGGYLPDANVPGGSLFYGGPQYTLYRGSIWVELGLRVPNVPELTLRYEHAFRNGEKDSTSWGGTNQTGLTAVPNKSSQTRKILPSFWGINESRDIFTFNAKYLIGKPDKIGNTDVNLGMRYEFDRTDNQLNFANYSVPNATYPAPAGTFPLKNAPGTPNQYLMTNTQQVSLAIYDGHISTVTRFGDKLWMTTAFSYVTSSSDIGGSRIAGPSYASPYAPYYNNLQYAAPGGRTGPYIDLGGGSSTAATVGLLNFLWMPTDTLQIAPSFRVECANTDSNSTYLTTTAQTVGLVTITPAVAASARGVVPRVAARPAVTQQAVTVPAGTVSSPTLVASHSYITNISEGLQIRYTGIRSLVLYAQCDWDQSYESRGDVTPTGSYAGTLPITTARNTASKLNFSANNQAISQKYALGANWYPLVGLNASVQYYYQLQNINQNINTDDPVRANQRLIAQTWSTNDVNFRVTWQPLSTLSLVTRYDFQRTEINSQWQYDSGGHGMFTLPWAESSIMTNNMLTETLTWQPSDRFYVQGSLSYVLNKISSPASMQTPAITNSNNNYWTAGAGLGYALDSKTDIRGDFTMYSANNYVNNAQWGVPYGAGGNEYTFSASLSRRISKNVSLSVKYYLDSYQDQLSGGNNNFLGQMIATNLQVRF